MTFEQAARRQYRRGTFYVVYLVGPAGERERLGRTQRRNGAGLRSFLRLPTVQMRFGKFPDSGSIVITRKTASTLEFSNGWRMEFGGTIREEASEAERRGDVNPSPTKEVPAAEFAPLMSGWTCKACGLPTEKGCTCLTDGPPDRPFVRPGDVRPH
jgi:hypothetical protein